MLHQNTLLNFHCTREIFKDVSLYLIHVSCNIHRCCIFQAKHLQMTSGLQLTAYWMANLTADMLLSILFVILSLIIFLIFQEFVPAYSGVALLAVLILLLLLCWSSAPLVYLISLPFQNIYTAYTMISFFMTTLESACSYSTLLVF